jgi:hypothetical protein
MFLLKRWKRAMMASANGERVFNVNRGNYSQIGFRQNRGEKKSVLFLPTQTTRTATDYYPLLLVPRRKKPLEPRGPKTRSYRQVSR